MSDDPNTPDEVPEESAEESAESKGTPSVRPLTANPLSRETDAAARPGFRSPANKRSKAQKKGKKKR